MRPFYKEAAFWTTIVTAIAAVLGAVFGPDASETTLFGVAGAAIVTYLVQKGIIVRTAIQAESEERTSQLLSEQRERLALADIQAKERIAAADREVRKYEADRMVVSGQLLSRVEEG
jgi:hypothetical protein